MFPMLSVALLLLISVVDPWHFGKVSDPGPQIHTTELPIQLRIQILLFSSVAFKMSRNKIFFT